MTTKDLIVYVTGISGMCSKGYTGCGKSCLCRQFIHDEYMEESYSILGQAEFESHVINQEHTIYWGKKKQTYLLSNEEMNRHSVTVNFEVFEHTTLYRDDTSEPFHGHDNYEDQIFTPYTSFQNKQAFRSRADTLNLETNDSKKFLISSNVPVAYLYVVDVSQSCSIFKTQMQLMSRLMRSIQNTHYCVVVASKFDTHCEKNVKFLESFAKTMNVAVIKCSSKHNSNVNTAFECLAVEALSLTHNAAEAQDVTQKQAWIAESHVNAEYFTKRCSTLPSSPQCGSASYKPLRTPTISHKTSSCSQDNLVVSNNKEFTSRNRLSSAFSKIFFSKKSNKATEHHITIPTTYKQNTTLGLPTLQYKEAVSSCPDFSKRFQRTSDIGKLSSSVSVFHSDPETARIRTEKLLPPMQPNAINQLSGQPNNPKLHHFRSTMPLPLTPLDLAITTDSSVSTSSIGRSRSSSGISSAGMQESSKADSVFADETDTVTKSDKDSDAQVKKFKHDYQRIESLFSLLFNSSAATTAGGETDDGKDLVTSDKFIKNNEERNTSGSNDIMTRKTSVNTESVPSTDVSTSPDTKAGTWFNEDKDYVISDYEFFKGVRQLQLASANYLTITSTDKELSYHHTTHRSEQSCKQQHDQFDMSQKDDKNYAQIGSNIYDKINLERVTHTNQCTCEQRNTSDMGDYTFMHATTCPHLEAASLTYDYVDQFYVTMLRQNCKKYNSGVPPRKVNRPRCKPLLDISACPNNTKTHDATYVNCSNIRRQCGSMLLPPRQFHTNNMDTSSVPPAEPTTPPRNIPRLGHYLSAPPAVPTT